ncbi:MAG: DNA gyrase/topoisomerase IV subunit A, partial [Bacteroidota bacterium]
GTPGSKVLYFTANPNGEAEGIRVELKPKPRLKKTSFDFNFAEIAIKGRSSMGNTLTKFAVRKIEQRQEGISTLGSLNIWYDETVQRLNTDERGVLLGAFSGADRIIILMQSGQYRLTSFDLSTHFDEDMILLEKYNPEKVYTAVYQEHETKHYYIKRFKAELTDKKVEFVEDPDKLILFSADPYPKLEMYFDMKLKTKGTEQEEIVAHEYIGVKGYKAKGKRLSAHTVKKVNWLESITIEEPAAPDETLADEISAPFPFRVDAVEDKAEIQVESTPPADQGSTPEPMPLIGIPLLKPGMLPMNLLTEDDIPRNQEPPAPVLTPRKPPRKKKTEGAADPSGETGEPESAGQMELPL